MVLSKGAFYPHVVYSVYESIITKVKKAEFGCYIWNTFVGSMNYADDTVLLRSTLSSLKLMLDICHNLSKNLNLISNDLGCTRELVCSSPGYFKQLLNIYEYSLYNEQARSITGNIKDLIYIRDAKCTRIRN